MNHLKIINFLEKYAFNNKPVSRAKISSCIVYKNSIISVGTNKRKSDPFQLKYSNNENKIFIHAEIEAIKKSLYFLSMDELHNSSIYICRVKWENTERKKIVWGSSFPCTGCMKAIIEFNIKKVIYTDYGNEIKILER